MSSTRFAEGAGRRIRPILLIPLLVLTGIPVDAAATARATADEPPAIRVSVGRVSPGVVTTSLVSVAGEGAALAGGQIRYRIEALAGTRIFGGLEGVIAEADLGEPVIPITYSVGRLQLAGYVQLAKVELENAAGEVWTVELGADIVSDYRIEIELRTPEPKAEVGGTFDIRYALMNLGNVADSVSIELEGDATWRAESGTAVLVVEPGQKLEGETRVRVPATANPGDRLLLRLVARGRGTVVRSELLVSIAFPEQPTNFALPIRFFTGAAGGPGRAGDSDMGWSLTGNGEVAAGTHLAFSMRSRSDLVSRPAFVGAMAGPSFWASLRRGNWESAFGEIMQGGDPVTGGQLQGRGASAAWRAGAFNAGAAYVRSGNGASSSGQAMTADFGVRTGFGELGIAMRSEARDRQEMGSGTLRGAVGTFQKPQEGSVRIVASAGVVSLETTQGSFLSPVGHADISRYTSGGSFSFRVRRSPAEADLFEARSSELFAGGTLELGGGLGATGWYADDELAGRLPGVVGRTTAASAGLRYAAGRFQAVTRGTYRTTRLPSVDSISRRPAVAFDLSAPIGPVAATVTVERRLAAGGPLIDYLQGGLRHATGSAWTSLTGTYSTGLGTATIGRIDVVESVRIGRAQVDFAAGTAPTAAWRQSLSAWSKVEMAIGRGLSMIVGAEYAPMAGASSPVRFSIGFGRALSVGLPTRRPAELSGVAFHDLNGDGIRDPGEPGFAGLVLRQGSESATTDIAGGFQLRGSVTAGALSVDPASLPTGFVVPTRALARTGRGMEIPMVQTAALTLDLFIDADADGELGERETHAPGVVVSLTHQSGIRYTEAADANGRLSFSSLPPGGYVGEVQEGEGIQKSAFELRLEIGARVERAVAVRKIEREIRFGNQ